MRTRRYRERYRTPYIPKTAIPAERFAIAFSTSSKAIPAERFAIALPHPKSIN